MFGHITIYKVTNLKVHSKGRYIYIHVCIYIYIYIYPFPRTTTNGSFGLQSCFPVFVTSQIVNPTYGNLAGWGVGRTLGWAMHVSKPKPSVGVFISLYFLWKPTVFRKFWICHFHFILHIMSDKAAFVSWDLFCVQPYRGNNNLIICIYMQATNSASLWDYGIKQRFSTRRPNSARNESKCGPPCLMLQSYVLNIIKK